MITRTARALIGLGVAALALAGCASGGVPGGDATASEEPSANALEVSGAWLDGGRAVGVVTQGSSSCVPQASEVTSEADGTVSVVLLDDPAAACTRDLVPRVSMVALPAGVTPGDALDLVVDYGGMRGEFSLEEYAGPEVQEFTPSAAWLGEGSLAVLTWGSSSCAPTVDTAAATDLESVTVTFAELPADQVCTMDMAPRVVLTHVDGEASRDATLTLTGGDLGAPVTVPLA